MAEGKALARTSTLESFLKIMPAQEKEKSSMWKPKMLTENSILNAGGDLLMKGVVSANFMKIGTTAPPSTTDLEGRNHRDWVGDVTIITDKISTGVKGKLQLRGEQLVLTTAAPTRDAKGAVNPPRVIPLVHVLRVGFSVAKRRANSTSSYYMLYVHLVAGPKLSLLVAQKEERNTWVWLIQERMRRLQLFPESLKEGNAQKLSRRGKWAPRWFVLKGGQLYYYKHNMEVSNPNPEF